MEIEADGRAARAVQELISKLENNEWEDDHMTIDVAMVPHLVRHVERFRLALRGYTITGVHFYLDGLTAEVEVSAEDFAILGREFASLESLKTVSLQALVSRIAVNNLTAAASFVSQTTQIQELTLHGGRESHRFGAQRYADLLVHLPELMTIQVVGMSPEKTGIITRAYPSLPNLKWVALGHLGGSVALDDMSLQQALRVSTLQSLMLFQCGISADNLLAISELLSSNSHVGSLRFSQCQLPKNGLELLAASLKDNKTLEILSFSQSEVNEIFFRTLKDSLSENKTLRYLNVNGHTFTRQSAIDLVAGVTSNYSLSTVDFDAGPLPSCIDERQECFLKCIPRLNRAGRRYLVEDPTSVRQGLRVLMKVRDDIDCLFLHLQENPSLCTEVIRSLAIIEIRRLAIIENGNADRSGCFSGAVHLWSHLRSCLSKKKRT